jgi:hypothetical protein
MRRLVFTFTAAALLGVMAPAAALAKKHHHHARHHHSAAHRARVRRIGNLAPTTTPTTTPGTTPTKPATPTAAATVTSYSGGVLTITPSNGAGAGPIAGMVTSDTRLKCVSMSASSTTGDNDADDATTGDNDSDDSAASSTSGEHHGDDGDGNSQGGDDNGQGDDEHGDHGEHGGDNGMSMSNCTVAQLTAGTGVLGAELMITATGAEWEKVILLTP